MVRTYFVSFIGESIMNPAFYGYVGGRIEVTPSDTKTGYASEEIRFLTKRVEEFETFRDKYDFKDVDKKTLDTIRSITARIFMDPVE